MHTAAIRAINMHENGAHICTNYWIEYKTHDAFANTFDYKMLLMNAISAEA